MVNFSSLLVCFCRPICILSSSPHKFYPPGELPRTVVQKNGSLVSESSLFTPWHSQRSFMLILPFLYSIFGPKGSPSPVLFIRHSAIQIAFPGFTSRKELFLFHRNNSIHGWDRSLLSSRSQPNSPIESLVLIFKRFHRTSSLWGIKSPYSCLFLQDCQPVDSSRVEDWVK